MAYLVSVYRDASEAGDCTNNGVSARWNRLYVLDEATPWPTNEYAAGLPVCRLERSTRAHPVIRPHPKLLRDGVNAWTMNGGNFAASSDSSWIAAVADISGGNRSQRAVPIHDREE